MGEFTLKRVRLLAFHEYQRANWRAKHGLALLRGSMCIIIRSRAIEGLVGITIAYKQKANGFDTIPYTTWMTCDVSVLLLDILVTGYSNLSGKLYM